MAYINLAFPGADDQFVARAILVGMARIQLLHARTKDACITIADTADASDWRDDLPDSLLGSIQDGLIRTDALWSRGADLNLNLIAESAFGIMKLRTTDETCL